MENDQGENQHPQVEIRKRYLAPGVGEECAGTVRALGEQRLRQ